ncbi:GumC family protein [Planctomycetes bacterium K23_9]|uniref:non-specific protein-tyrosine kinase n=1 Tax=Stieleria marina TaxID=1930275 RepID=A0A517NSK8_9BACT|nr:Tyrosine-protein kinase ptk [Planctomycetes bacterium K23_9]
MTQVDPNLNNQTADDSEALDLIGVLRRRIGFIVLGVTLGLIAAGLYLLLTTPTYRAEMEILVGQKSADMVNGASSNTSVEGANTDGDVLSTHIQLMTSRRILKKAIADHELTDIASVSNAIDEGKNPLEYIRDHLHVTKGGLGVAKDAHTLQATYDDPSPEDCAVVLRAIFDAYDVYLKEHFSSNSSQAIDLLSQLANDTADEVREAEQNLTKHLASSKVMWDGSKTTNIYKKRLESIEIDLLELTENEAHIESRLAVISDFVENADPEKVSDFDRLALLSEKEVNRLKVLFDVTRGDTMSEAFVQDNPIRQETAKAEYNDYLNLVMREKKLTENFGDDHPTVVSIREQITMMRKFIDDKAAEVGDGAVIEKMKPDEMLQTYVGLLENDLAGLQREREVLVRRSEAELVSAKKLEEEEMMAESLKLELVRKQALYEKMSDTLSELNFVRDYAGFDTDVIGDADIQEQSSWPDPKIVLPLGMIAGLALGVMLAFIADLCDTTFADPEDVEKTLGAPVLAHVNRFAPIRRKRNEPAFEIDSSVYAFHRPRSPEAEIYRVIRTSMLMSAKAKDQRIIQVTGPLPGDGKSTTSANLAVAFAQAGKRVLLIDADLRKPRVAKLFRLENTLGLSEAIGGLADAADVISDTVVDNLWAVGSGAVPANPAELLQSEDFASLLKHWAEEFDYVIVDSPPVLAVSDAAIISQKCDVTLLALRIVKNGRRIAHRAITLLRQHDANVVGLVINGYQSSNKNYGYIEKYDSDSYGYGYGPTSGGYYRSADATAETVKVSSRDAEEAPVAAGSRV